MEATAVGGKEEGSSGGHKYVPLEMMEMEQKQEAGSLFLETGRSVSRSVKEPEKRRREETLCV